MANTMSYPVVYKKKMDEVFKASAVTSILEASEDAISFKGTEEQEFKIQKLAYLCKSMGYNELLRTG